MFKPGADEEKAESARLVIVNSFCFKISEFLFYKIFFFFSIKKSAFVGAIAIGDLIKSTLGPKGMVNEKKNK